MTIITRALWQMMDYRGREPYVVISFRGGTDEPIVLPDDSMREATLTIVADDLFAPHEAYPYFTPEHARQILDFVNNYRAQSIENIVVHCQAGKSRSRGCANAIRCLFGLPEEGAAGHNPLVYHTILSAAHLSS